MRNGGFADERKRWLIGHGHGMPKDDSMGSITRGESFGEEKRLTVSRMSPPGARVRKLRDRTCQSPGSFSPVRQCGDDLLEALDGGGFIVFYIEDGVQLGDLKQVVHLLGEVKQF